MLLGNVFRLSLLIERGSVLFARESARHCVPEAAKLAKPCGVQEFSAAYRAAAVPYNAAVWLKRLCILCDRHDLLGVVLRQPGRVASPERCEPKKGSVVTVCEERNSVFFFERAPWETFFERTMERRKREQSEMT